MCNLTVDPSVLKRNVLFPEFDDCLLANVLQNYRHARPCLGDCECNFCYKTFIRV